MMKEKDLGGDQRRAGKEDGRRDPHFHSHHRSNKKSQGKKAVDETTVKVKTTIDQNGICVEGHAKWGRNPWQPDFLSRYHSQANRSHRHLYAAKGSGLTNARRGGLGSETKPEGEGMVDSRQGTATHEG